MLIAITGGTGFLGRYIVNHLLENGHRCRCWYRPSSDRGGFVSDDIQWLEGELDQQAATDALVDGADAVVHCGVSWHGSEYRPDESIANFAQRNIVGSVRLMEQAQSAGARRFVYISTCAVHEKILDDRKLDEAHPLWPGSSYGAHKAAVEKFVHSFGMSDPAFGVCALRPTGIYGLRRPLENSRWVRIVRDVLEGKPVQSARGGKEVHAADVARAVGVLLTTDQPIAGQAYNCYDRYIAEQDVAQIAKDLTAADSEIKQLNQGPKHQIDTTKVRDLGMTFGGQPLLEQYVKELVEALGR